MAEGLYKSKAHSLTYRSSVLFAASRCTVCCFHDVSILKGRGGKSAMKKTIKIGGASGFWGESMMATPQLLRGETLDYIVYDYLAEITMSIMARARASNPDLGYATDFVSGVIKPHLAEIKRQGVKILSNAGGVNPDACAKAVRAAVAEAGLDLKVAVVRGDDLLPRADALRGSITEMFSGDAFPADGAPASMNAYLGAFPVAAALSAGADIVITGRSVDSAVTLGACIHAFGWQAEDWDHLASGSLAGHIIECGPQTTGGNFTDWEDVDDIANIGYPIVEVSADGSFTVSKPDGTGGLVSVGTVAEQMLYEIGDPQAYMLPDVVCDFSATEIKLIDNHRVHVSGAKGYPAPATYKVSATYFHGFRGGTLLSFVGRDADRKAERYADQLVTRCRHFFRERNIPDFDEVSVEVIGADSQFGSAPNMGAREVVLKLAVKHPDQQGVGLLLREASGLALATPPGLSIFAGSRPKPSPVVRLFSFEIAKSEVPVEVEVDGRVLNDHPASVQQFFSHDMIMRVAPPSAPEQTPTVSVPLEKLAWGRSGDKGNKSNIGVIARQADYLPYIWAALDEPHVRAHFAHFVEPGSAIDRYHLPGSHAMNIVMHDALGGGGVASLRNDPQGKAYAQILLAFPIPIPSRIAETLA